MRKELWCQKNVDKLMVAQFRIEKTRRTFAGEEPEYKMEAEVNRFPAGKLPIKG